MSLRNEIEKIQLELVEKTANPTTKWEDVIPEATSQILSLLEGSLPKEIGISGLYSDGWNAYRAALLERLKDDTKNN